jgi:DNA repair protein RecO (recombination protein O)
VCARTAGLRRLLPPEARASLDAWLRGSEADVALDGASARAHQRLLREFLREHLTDGRPLRAFEAWEGDRWAAPSDAAEPVAP